MNLESNDIDLLARLALDAARAASAIIQQHKPQQTSMKPNMSSEASSIVTEIDLQCQTVILNYLQQSIVSYDLGLLTEELQDDQSRLVKDYFWCIDPLDGTLPFTEGKAGYAVSIALINRAGDPILCVVIDPYRQEQWLAIKGRGVWRNDAPYTPVPTSNTLVCRMDRSFLKSKDYEETVQSLQELSERLGYEELAIKTGYGAVMNALSLLDSGTGCYFKFPKSQLGGGCIWDFAATRLIFEELGLHATTIAGQVIMLNSKASVYMNDSGIIFTTDPVLHQELINLCANRQ